MPGFESRAAILPARFFSRSRMRNHASKDVGQDLEAETT